MKKIFLFLFFIAYIIGASSGYAFDISQIPKSHTYVLDQADIFSPQEEEKLTLKLKTIESQTTAEILVVSLPDLGGDDISRIGVQIGEHLGVGKSDVDNGLIILIAPNEREWNISTGYGLEGVLPDIRTKHIGERNFPQYFRENQYYQGISQSLDDIHGFLISDESIISSYDAKYYANNEDTFEDNIALIIFGSLFLSSFIYRKKEKRKIRFIKFLFLSTITSIIVYSLISLGFVLINVIIQSLLALLVDKTGNWNSAYSNGSHSRKSSRSSLSSRSRSFGGGSFGGGGSRGKW